MATKTTEQPFGPSPYQALAKLIDDVERAVGMDWTNNVQQHAPESAKEAYEAWDDAYVLVSQIEEAAEKLMREARRMADEAEERWSEAEDEEAAPDAR